MSHAVQTVVTSYLKTHGIVLETVEDLSDDQIAYRPCPTRSGSKAAWSGGIKAWRRPGASVRTDMELEASGTLLWPSKYVLLDYCRRAFETANEAVHGLDDTARQRSVKWGRRSVGQAVMTNLEHDNCNLGMIESMRGMLSLRGSATE